MRRIGIRVCLQQIRGLGEKTARAIVAQREERLFVSLSDLLGRVRMSSEEAKALIFSGACDGLGPSRPAMLWQLSMQLRQGRAGQARAEEPGLLFAAADAGQTAADEALPILRKTGRAESGELPAHLVEDYDAKRLLELERQYLSFSPGGHPTGVFADVLAGQDIVRSIDISTFVGRTVTIAGIIVATRRAVTRGKELMQFVTLEDRWGLVEVILFPDVYGRLGGTFESFGPYLVRGVVQENLGSVVLIGGSVQRVDGLPSEQPGYLPAPADAHGGASLRY